MFRYIRTGPPPWRRSTGSVSGWRQATRIWARAISASVKKIARQPAASLMTPPSSGARIGATPMISIMTDSAWAAAEPRRLSAIIARVSTTPVPPATPWKKRAAINTAAVGAIAHTTEATSPNAIPKHNSPRRPRPSESGPISSCPMAMPTM